MKHLAMAMAQLEQSEKRMEEEYAHRRNQLILKLDEEYAEARRYLSGAKKAIRKRFAQHHALQEDFYWKFHDAAPHDTDPETTARMKRSMNREKKRRNVYAV